MPICRRASLKCLSVGELHSNAYLQESFIQMPICRRASLNAYLQESFTQMPICRRDQSSQFVQNCSTLLDSSNFYFFCPQDGREYSSNATGLAGLIVETLGSRLNLTTPCNSTFDSNLYSYALKIYPYSRFGPGYFSNPGMSMFYEVLFRYAYVIHSTRSSP